jgi:hypothetical protein
MVAFSAAPNGEFDMPPEIKKADLKTRNRWSAKMSRVRKKAHLDKLHAQIDELTNHNLELASVCEDLVKDNGLLRKELEGFGGQAPAVAQAETSGNPHFLPLGATLLLACLYENRVSAASARSWLPCTTCNRLMVSDDKYKTVPRPALVAPQPSFKTEVLLSFPNHTLIFHHRLLLPTALF